MQDEYQHYTAWLTTTPALLEGVYADVTVLLDDAAGFTVDADGNEIAAWTSIGDPVFYQVTDVRWDDPENAVKAAENALDAAGWRITSSWEPVDSGHIAVVERRD